jgi:ABC-2 type transport system permease protein
MLDEFRAYTKYIDYEFINPAESNDPAEIKEIRTQLYRAGLNPTNVSVRNNDGSSQELVIWPGALVSYRNDTEIAIDFMSLDRRASGEISCFKKQQKSVGGRFPCSQLIVI